MGVHICAKDAQIWVIIQRKRIDINFLTCQRPTNMYPKLIQLLISEKKYYRTSSRCQGEVAQHRKNVNTIRNDDKNQREEKSMADISCDCRQTTLRSLLSIKPYHHSFYYLHKTRWRIYFETIKISGFWNRNVMRCKWQFTLNVISR